MHLKEVRAVLGIGAGKGGVGKSAVTACLARALHRQGHRVGVLDADIYGPSMRMMLPEDEPPHSCANRILPARSRGISLMSMAYCLGEGEPAAVRAPIATQAVSQFIRQVEWGALDFLLIDFPPGTGDLHLTLLQEASLTAALVVTTPQEVAALDVRKAIRCFVQMGVPVLGIVENMSYFAPPCTQQRFFPLGEGGGERLAKASGLPLLGSIPLDPELSRCADAGLSLFEEAPHAHACAVFDDLARKVAETEEEGARVEEICQTDASSCTLTWSDGWRATFTATDLQRRCPCTVCRSGEGGALEGARIEQIVRVGRYALRFRFSAGCSQGIYSLTALRRAGL
jgi:ATP-binding protein involved in chromosome partitioning